MKVFVDEAVLGDLPNVCVRTGEHADFLRPVNKPLGGMGAGAWLLLFLGPIGWLALLILSSAGTGRETLTVELPYSINAWERFQRRRRTLFGAVGATTVFTVLTFLNGNWLTLAIASFAVTIVAWFFLWREEIDVNLDGSRRWVTLGGVHPAFAAAVTARREASSAL